GGQLRFHRTIVRYPHIRPRRRPDIDVGRRRGHGLTQRWWASAPAAEMIPWQAAVCPAAPMTGWLPNAAASSSPLTRRASASRSRSSPVSAALTALYSASPVVLDSTAAVEACRVKLPNWPTLELSCL